jgi:pyrroloquinoline quinone (PQQ) biosynthesis protein C
LEARYAAMAADEIREQNARTWVSGLSRENFAATMQAITPESQANDPALTQAQIQTLANFFANTERLPEDFLKDRVDEPPQERDWN